LGAYLLLAVAGPVDRLPTVCPFRLLTGRDCPLCGLTRATHALARGHVRAALALNRLVFAWLGVGAWLLSTALRRSSG
jgi:hypothetical protein